VGSGLVREERVAPSQLIYFSDEKLGTQFNEADQLFFDQIVEAAVADEGLKQAAAVNPSDKFELVFKNLFDPAPGARKTLWIPVFLERPGSGNDHGRKCAPRQSISAWWWLS
jgi:hypothetical protein